METVVSSAYLVRANQIPHLLPGQPGNTVNQRGYLRETQIKACVFHCSAGSRNRSSACSLRSYGIVEIFLTDRILFGQGLYSLQSGFGVGVLRLRLRQGTLSLPECSLERTWIDFKEDLAFPDKIAFFVILFYKITCNLWSDDRIYQTIGCADPFVFNRNVSFDYFHNLNYRRGRCSQLLFSYKRQRR